MATIMSEVQNKHLHRSSPNHCSGSSGGLPTYICYLHILTFTPLSPSSPISSILPLALVIVAAMVKEAIEDWRWKMQVSL